MEAQTNQTSIWRFYWDCIVFATSNANHKFSIARAVGALVSGVYCTLLLFGYFEQWDWIVKPILAIIPAIFAIGVFVWRLLQAPVAILNQREKTFNLLAIELKGEIASLGQKIEAQLVLRNKEEKRNEILNRLGEFQEELDLRYNVIKDQQFWEYANENKGAFEYKLKDITTLTLRQKIEDFLEMEIPGAK